ncbi:MAG TPA: YhcH/YjgK/YiaL family protein [Verrucomicrobiae bacterium]
MIADTLAQCHRYASLSPRFAPAFDFLKKLPANQPLGRVDLDGDNCFALIQSYTSKPIAQAKFEAHKKYIDIQFIQAGRESLLWSPLTSLTETLQPYAEDKDVALYGIPSRVTPVNLGTGEFVIFFPEDGHAPGVEYGGAVEVRKVVIKVRV